MMQYLFIVTLALLGTASLSEASCKREITDHDNQTTSWTTRCDNGWSELGKNMGWAKGCGYWDLRDQFWSIHSKIKAYRQSDTINANLAQKYYQAYEQMLGYDTYSGCSRGKVEQVIGNAETMFEQAVSTTPVEQNEVRSSDKSVAKTVEVGKQRILENSTALISMDPKIHQLTVKSDGEEYLQVWSAVKSRKSMDVGVLVSNKKIKPKRFEFVWNPLRNSYAAEIDGVSTIFVDDEPIFDAITDAYELHGEYIYVAVKFNDTMAFKWWRLKRAVR